MMQTQHAGRTHAVQNQTVTSSPQEAYQHKTSEQDFLTGSAIQRKKMNVHSLSPAHLMHLQRTIGNRSVSALFNQSIPRTSNAGTNTDIQKRETSESIQPQSERSQQSLSSKPVISSSKPDIQRKVYIKRTLLPGYRNKTKSSHGNEGKGQRNVDSMMSDEKSRYFDSKEEMTQYAAGTTDKVGYVEKTNTWIRIPSELTVIGEDHTETTIADVVKAVGTDKFMYEGFTEHPPEASDNPELEEAMKSRDAYVTDKFGGVGVGPESKNHRSESFYPKIVRALQGVTVNEFFYDVEGSSTEITYLAMAIRLASSAQEGSALYQTYMANEEMWKQTAATASSASMYKTPLVTAMKQAGSSQLFTDFIRDLSEYAYSKIEQEQAAAPAEDKDAFAENWHVAKKDYDKDGSDIMKAEKARDFSMYQHIKKAQSDGYLLYGLGDMHLQRLKELLDAESIKNVNMDKFISKQATDHPQT